MALLLLESNFYLESRKFCQRGPTLITFFSVFLVDEGREDSSCHHWLTSEAMAFGLLADDGTTLNAGFVAL